MRDCCCCGAAELLHYDSTFHPFTWICRCAVSQSVLGCIVICLPAPVCAAASLGCLSSRGVPELLVQGGPMMSGQQSGLPCGECWTRPWAATLQAFSTTKVWRGTYGRSRQGALLHIACCVISMPLLQ